jgi:hypothetical protein
MNTEIYGDISDLLLAKYINFNTGDRFDNIIWFYDKQKKCRKTYKRNLWKNSLSPKFKTKQISGNLNW